MSHIASRCAAEATLHQQPKSSLPALATTRPAEIELKEWKYTGYRGFSNFISSDDDFFILRRFGSLNALVLLALQNDISSLEQDLALLDEEYSSKTAPDRHNGSFRQDLGSSRSNLLRNEIYTKLKDYNSFVLQYAQIRARPLVPVKDVRSLKNWLYNHRNAIEEQETKYINCTSDLFSLVPKSKSPLRRLLERSAHFRIFRIWRIKRDDLEAHDKEHEFYISDQRIDAFVSFVITTFGLGMLIAPLWILNTVDNPVKCLAIITVFILIFMCLVSSVTVAKPFETLGATAAYSAVLMVFLQLEK